MLIGYARVSTLEQNLNLQLDALKSIGCEKLYEDKISSSKLNRCHSSKWSSVNCQSLVQ